MQKIDNAITTHDDFVLYKENGLIKGGGFSIFMEKGISPIQTMQYQEKEGSPLQHLVVPAGLFFQHVTPILQSQPIYDLRKEDEDDVIPDDIYNHLLRLASEDETKVLKRNSKKRLPSIKKNKSVRRSK